MTTILVRAARPDEHANWYPLWRGYQAFYKVDIAEEVSRVTWQRFFDDHEPMHCDFAEVDGVVRGFHKPIMIAGGLGTIEAAQTHKLGFAAGTLLVQLGGPGLRIGMGLYVLASLVHLV